MRLIDITHGNVYCVHISFLPTLQAKLQQGLTNCQKKNQNCCYFHFDPFTEDCNNAIDKEIDLSNFGVHCVLQGILHW